MNAELAQYPQVYLNPGELVICDQPSVVTTVLGSCVSVTLLHRKTGIGAICHGLLPDCQCSQGCARKCPEGARYMKCSIRIMIDELKMRGIPPRELEVKIFGGADMFHVAQMPRSRINVGSQNVRTSLSVLGEYGLQPVSADTGGCEGRKLYFVSDTGEVYLKRLRKQARKGRA